MRLSWNEIRARAAEFARERADATYEKGETQSFYNEFFDIFGVRRRTVARYEEHGRQETSLTCGMVSSLASDTRRVQKYKRTQKIGSPGRFGIDVYTLGWPNGSGVVARPGANR